MLAIFRPTFQAVYKLILGNCSSSYWVSNTLGRANSGVEKFLPINSLRVQECEALIFIKNSRGHAIIIILSASVNITGYFYLEFCRWAREGNTRRSSGGISRKMVLTRDRKKLPDFFRQLYRKAGSRLIPKPAYLTEIIYYTSRAYTKTSPPGSLLALQHSPAASMEIFREKRAVNFQNSHRTISPASEFATTMLLLANPRSLMNFTQE